MFVRTWFTRAVIQLILVFLVHVRSENQNSTGSCTSLYEMGVEAYLENDFNGCVINFENAIEKYRLYAKKLRNCRLKCRKEAEDSKHFYPFDVENLNFYERTLKTTLCILKCKLKDSYLFGPYNINKETEKLFEDAKPYEYLHICYFQVMLYT